MEEWTDIFANHIVKQIHSLILKQVDDPTKVQFARDLEERIIGKFVATLVLQALSWRPEGVSKASEVEGHVQERFAQLKVDIQDHISNGFKKGVADYCGQDVDYYCQIRVFKEPKNKQYPC